MTSNSRESIIKYFRSPSAAASRYTGGDDQSLLKNANKFNAASKKLNCLQLMVLRLNIFFVSTLAVYQHVPMMSDVTGQ